MHRPDVPGARLLPGTLLLAVLTGAASSLSAAHDRVRYEAGRLSVEFRDLELEQALEQVADETGVEFSISARVQGRITRQFDALPLEAALRRLLEGMNFILLHDDDADSEPQVRRVVVLGKGRSGGGRLSTSGPSPVAGRGDVLALQPQPSVPHTQGPREVVIPARQGGHYIFAGTINGRRVEFLVDTGASLVALSSRTAGDLGLAYGREIGVETANGATKGFATTLERVALGPLGLERVRAIIMPGMDDSSRVLLGMSFLGAFELTQKDGRLYVREPTGP
jgi:aspartyl protease family protein